MVVHLGKRHKNLLRFHQVVVVQNMINDSGHYRHCKCECPDQVHNKEEQNNSNIDGEETIEIDFLLHIK